MEKMSKEAWLEEFKKKVQEARKEHPEWSYDKVKMVVSRGMPKMEDDGYGDY